MQDFFHFHIFNWCFHSNQDIFLLCDFIMLLGETGKFYKARPLETDFRWVSLAGGNHRQLLCLVTVQKA